MWEQLENYLKPFIKNDASQNEAFHLDEDGLVAHLDLSSTDGDGLYLQDGYTLRLNREELEHAKQLMAQAMGRTPTEEEFASNLCPLVARLLKESHRTTENRFLLGFMAVLIAIAAVVLSRWHMGFLGGLALAALLGMELLPLEKRPGKVWQNLLLVLFVGLVLWAVLAMKNR